VGTGALCPSATVIVGATCADRAEPAANRVRLVQRRYDQPMTTSAPTTNQMSRTCQQKDEIPISVGRPGLRAQGERPTLSQQQGTSPSRISPDHGQPLGRPSRPVWWLLNAGKIDLHSSWRRRIPMSSSSVCGHQGVVMAWIEQTGTCSWRVRYTRPTGGYGSVSGFSSRKAARDYAEDLESDRRRGG
jgi:hypothetical protein